MRLNKAERQELIERDRKRLAMVSEVESWRKELKFKNQRQCCICRKEGKTSFPNDDVRFIVVRWVSQNKFILEGYVCENHRYELEKDYQVIYRHEFGRLERRAAD